MFDAVGEVREFERDSGVAVDPTGRLAGGRPITGPEDLRNALVAEPELFVQALTEKLMVYALGRGLEAHDMPTVRAIVRDAGEQGYRMSALVAGIANSPAFRMRSAASAEAASAEGEAR